MNAVLYGSMAAGSAAVLWAIIRSVRKTKYPKSLYRFGETRVVLFLAALCYITGLYVNISRLLDPSTGGEGLPGVFLCAASGLLLMIIAAWLILYCLVRRILVYKEKVVMITALGKEKTQEWADLIRVEKQFLTRSSKLVFANGMVFSVQQSDKQYKPFMEFVKASMKGKRGRDLLRQAEKAMQGI